MFSVLLNFLKSRQLLPLLYIIGISIILIILPLGAKIGVSRLFLASVYYPFTRLDNFLTDVANARRNNIELNERLIRSSVKASQFTEDHYENMRLRRMLGFDLQIPYRLVPAEVIGLKPGSAVMLMEINAGNNQGVAADMPVVTADGIVGKTVGASANTSLVQLLVDHNCRVSAIDQNTRAMGIIRWSGGKLLELGDVPVESEIAVGDTIISSGLGGLFPPGLLIGTVVSTEDPEATLFKNILVKASVNFGTIEEVFVVVYDK